MYHIFNLTFSSGVTKSNANAELQTFPIHRLAIEFFKT